ncbi:MAG: site-specific integrase [Brucellaceae bacterium]|uniref:tyrosine-type recombinase/integrase n=1 Tax=Zhengella sp. TaxID=2282762 RepID=UPI0035283934|nr:site-specific integrase [Brucellaceae bacterium]
MTLRGVNAVSERRSNLRRRALAPAGHRAVVSAPRVKIVESVTVGELARRYLDILWEEGQHKRHVTAFLDEIDLLLKRREFSVFSEDMLDEVTGSLRAKGNSNATINRKMAALGKLLRKARKMGDIVGLPEFRRQKERQGRIRFLEWEEEDRLFSAIRAHSEDAWRLCVFLVDSGARLGEALALTWNDVHDGRATFWVTKSNRSRTVPLTARARDVLDMRRGRGLKGPFCMLNQQAFRFVWNKAKKECGLGTDPHVVPHILRHTCASRLVKGGVDIRRVQMWLGHQTLHVTMRYAHLAANDLDACVNVLEANRFVEANAGSVRAAAGARAAVPQAAPPG